MAEGSFHSQSIKQNFREDILDSRKQPTVYKLFEFFDDHSYGNSENMGMTIFKTPDNKKVFLVLFMEDGPCKPEIMKKLLEWRRSGDSSEIGHKGGGNKRNIYGHIAEDVTLLYKINNSKMLFAKTKPNKIFKLADSDLSENEFRNIIDTSDYNVVPSFKEDDEDLPSWCISLFNKIKTESGIDAKYLIRFSMHESNIPDEYNNQNKWHCLIKEICAKQYSIPIHIKNELLDDIDYKVYSNIDLIGLNDSIENREVEQLFPIYCNENGTKFLYKHSENGSYCDFETHKEISNDNSIKRWGQLRFFIAKKDYIDTQIREFNNGLETVKLTAASLFGVYLILNDKLTNYLPFSGLRELPEPKNFRVQRADGTLSHGCAYGRFIIEPDTETCADRSLFDKLIKTETIKAQTNFLPNSAYSCILKHVLSCVKTDGKPVQIHVPKIEDGQVYLIYLGAGLWKFGYVSNKKSFKQRIGQHKKESIEKIETFTGYTQKMSTAVSFWDKITPNPIGFEEKIKHTISRLATDDYIEVFKNKGDSNSIREYFTCVDTQYIIDDVIPMLEEIVI
jgi:hypothetical protein